MSQFVRARRSCHRHTAIGDQSHAGPGDSGRSILTFFLVFVVHGTAVDERAQRAVAGLAIGSTITLDILFGGPLTGAAMNPARVFGPALAAGFWKDHLVCWIGPFLGAGLGGLVYRLLIERKPEPAIS
ncbi:MAG: aquaporin [Spartobacteria bacterium]